MKTRTRLCAIFFTAAMLLAMVPTAVITSSAANTDDVVFQNFDTLTPANITDGGGTVVINRGSFASADFAIEPAGANTQSGQGMSLNLPAATPGSNPYFILGGTGMDVKPSTTEYSGIKFWVKYIGDSPVTLCISLLGTGQKDPGFNGTYYLQDAATDVIRKYRLKVSNHNASRGAMELPANFEGWVYYSLDAYTNAQREEVNAPTRFQIADFYSASNTVGRKIYFDSFYAYKTAPTNIIEDFDGSLTGEATVAQGSDTATVNCDSTGTINTDLAHSESGKSFKLDISAASISNKWFTLNQMGLINTTILDEDAGIKFWVTYTGTTPVNICLSPYDTTLGQQEFGFGSGKNYYLEFATDGLTLMYPLTQSTRNASAGTVALPAGFEGWVYLPFKALINNNLKELYRIQFADIYTTDAEAGRALYFDSVQLYDEVSTSDLYTISIDSGVAGGTLQVDKVESLSGTTITVTVTPASGMRLKRDSLKFNTTVISTGSSNTYTFKMPAANVTVTAEFIGQASTMPLQKKDLLAWYDASDTASLTISGGKVSEWKDISGNNKHASQSDLDFRPEYKNSNGVQSLVFEKNTTGKLGGDVNASLLSGQYLELPNGAKGMNLNNKEFVTSIVITKPKGNQPNPSVRPAPGNYNLATPFHFGESDGWGNYYMGVWQDAITMRAGGIVNGRGWYYKRQNPQTDYTYTYFRKEGTYENMYINGKPISWMNDNLTYCYNNVSFTGIDAYNNDYPGRIISRVGSSCPATIGLGLTYDGNRSTINTAGAEFPTSALPADINKLGATPYYSASIVSNSFYEGEICEIILVDKALSDAEISAMNQYIAEKYGIEPQDDPDVPDEPETGISPYKDMLAWYDAADAVYDASNKVSKIPDKSGNGCDAEQNTGENQPSLVENSLNGKPVINFNGTNSYLTFSDVDINQSTNAQLTMVAVSKANKNAPSPGAGQTDGSMIVNSTLLCLPESASWGSTVFNVLNDKLSARFGSSLGGTQRGTVYTEPTNPGLLSDFNYVYAMKNGASETFYLNGNKLNENLLYYTGSAAGVPPASSNPNQGLWGNYTSGIIGGARSNNAALVPTSWWAGDIAEIIIFKRALTESELADLNDYIELKYFNATSASAKVGALKEAFTTKGNAPELPEKVMVIDNLKYSGKQVAVTWDVSPSDYAQKGFITVEGAVTGYPGLKAKLTVTTLDPDSALVYGDAPAGMMAWYSASYGGLTEIGGGQYWKDISGNNRHALVYRPNNAPTWLSPAENNPYGSFEFNGVDNYLWLDGFNDMNRDPAGFTVAAVSKTAKNMPYSEETGVSIMNYMKLQPVVAFADYLRWGSMYISSYRDRAGMFWGAASEYGVAGWEYERENTIEGFTNTVSMKNGKNESLYVDGVNVIEDSWLYSSTYDTATGTNGIGKYGWIGRNRGTSVGDDKPYFEGEIAEIIIYDRALSAAETKQLNNYLNYKYLGLAPIVDQLDTTDPTNPTTPTDTDDAANNLRTGDNFPVYIFYILAVAAFVCTTASCYGKKREKAKNVR